ncbi:MAG: hypothetical protein IKR59_00955 [Lachnospiraceae bacterium]|nr:hypothetical protein [Lachnospiraceae bacterium]
MVIFKEKGKENTKAAAEIAVLRAKELGTDIVLSSGTGSSAEIVLAAAEELGYQGHITVVRSVTSAAENGINRMSPEMRASLEARGVRIISAAHALSAGERGLSTRFKGVYPLEIMANTLRMFGQGMKVCVECSVMALDGDAVEYKKPIVAIGGTGRGLDTAVVITPAYSANILDTVVNEILCKPGLYEA